MANEWGGATGGDWWNPSNKYFDDPMMTPGMSFEDWLASQGLGGATEGEIPPPGEEEEEKKRKGRTKPHWEESYHVADAPSWWKGMTANKLSHGAEQASIINAMIPFMSAKDQVAAASMLSSMFDAFKGYKNVGTVPNEEPDAADRQWMGSKERMQGMLNTLNMMREASGAKFDKGPGMAFMENVVKNMNANAAGAVGATQTRQQLLNMQNALSPFLAQTQNGALSPYGSLVKMLMKPSYTGGYLNPTTQIGNNEFISGSPLAGYF